MGDVGKVAEVWGGIRGSWVLGAGGAKGTSGIRALDSDPLFFTQEGGDSYLFITEMLSEIRSQSLSSQLFPLQDSRLQDREGGRRPRRDQQRDVIPEPARQRKSPTFDPILSTKDKVNCDQLVGFLSI